MAGENSINGNDAVQQAYNQADPYENAATAPATAEVTSAEQPNDTTAATETEEKPPTKEEIGWFFVEQYYKTLCNEPGKLHLYYNKRSQFVSGDEAEKVEVAVGQKAIGDRIKQLDIKDCKVRVLNVDSQESLKNILVQVIGEMSNKAEPHRKFVQTFVLAEQPSGYYVLNDVFRYIVLEEEEFENGVQGQDEMEAPAQSSKPDEEATEGAVSISQIDEKLESVAVDPSSGEAATNGHVTPAIAQDQAEDAPAPATDAAPLDSEVDVQAAEISAMLEETQPEVPKDPEPSPTPTSRGANTAMPTSEPAPEPLKPAAPKTWANLVAANRAAVPAVPSGQTGASSTNSGNPPAAKVKPAVPSTGQSADQAASTADETAAQPQQNGSAGWQMAGAGNDRRQNRQHAQSVSGGSESVLGYVKNVTDKVDASILKEKLNAQGKLTYFDVSRPKNCAFVEFENVAAYKSVIAANPYMIGGEQVIVEERRPRANAYGGNFPNRGGMRGGRGGNENRPNNSGRGNFGKDGGRGNYNNRSGRGGTPARGRTGQVQAA